MWAGGNRLCNPNSLAKRIFKQSHPNLFQTVLDQMPELPVPRKRDKVLPHKFLSG
ncbi:DUF6399 domain-containing protein [Adonisia turfae]|uniref:DUF6399 domain-containing protein n=1 Tax=Adonisia turfae TaxID=2950184 RepID=UPI003D6F6333